MGNIAVFGGTFNPIHSEHIKMVEHLSGLDFIDSILVIPTHIPPHKEVSYLASDEDRLNMCRLALGDIKKVKVSDFEIKRQGKSYTFYTLSAMRKENPEDNFYVVCGADMAITLDTWHRYNELKELCTFLVINRKGTDENELSSYLNALKNDGAKIIISDLPTEDISSTKLRAMLNNGQYNDLPEKIANYIKEKGLYKHE